MALTDTGIRALKPSGTRYLVTDGRGLCLEVLPSGKFSWLFRMAGMNSENAVLEAFYLTTRPQNRCRVHITESSEWLENGVHLKDLRSFYDVVMGRQSK